MARSTGMNGVQAGRDHVGSAEGGSHFDLFR